MAGQFKTVSRNLKRRHSYSGFADINVTPLVDVMLVLLVVFMITAPMLSVGVPVDLPKTKAAKMNDQVEPLVVTVDAEGKSYLQETELEGEALVARLMAVTGNNPDAKIYVRGDKKLPYGRIMEVMGEIAASGFHKVSLIAEMPTPSLAAMPPSVPPITSAVPVPALPSPALTPQTSVSAGLKPIIPTSAVPTPMLPVPALPSPTPATPPAPIKLPPKPVAAVAASPRVQPQPVASKTATVVTNSPVVNSKRRSSGTTGTAAPQAGVLQQPAAKRRAP